MDIKFFHRDFSAEIIAPRSKNEVSMLEWNAIGGPEKAQIDVSGQDVWEFIERLRCPVKIYNDRHKVIWWGYVDGVTINDSNLQVSVNLTEFANRVRVSYSQVNVAGTIGEKAISAWAEDATSRNEYGKREKSVFLSQGTSEQALNLQRTLLDRWKYPIPGSKLTSSAGELTAKISCVGWWQSLDWVYYENDSGKEGYEESGSSDQNLGDNSARQIVAQSFQVSSAVGWEAQTIRLRLKKVGTPSDTVSVSLCADGGGVPGTILASASFSGASLGEYQEWIEFTLSARVALSTSTTYWIRVLRSGSISSNNYYVLAVNQDLGYVNGMLKIYTGSSWVTRSPDADMLFAVGGVEETTSQLETMINTSGEFITAVDVDVDSGVYSCPYRDGDQFALAEIIELLNSGTTNHRRVLADVDENRRARLYEEPVAGSYDNLMTKHGEFFDYLGKPVKAEDIRPGGWMRLKDVVPASTDTTLLADMTRFFVESVVYYPKDQRVDIVPRDQSKILKFGGI
jgi:hypothetical protein